MKISRFFRQALGTHSQKELARAEGLLEQIEDAGRGLAKGSDDELRQRASRLRARARDGLDPDALLVETFALVREASARTIGLRPYDVQIIGAIALHHGNIAEMKTGEGKTLAATLPVALNALGGHGVHVVTVNDYLASRDAAWMRPVYELLGLSVGVITEELDPEQHRDGRRAAYAADITYVTNHELVFDYLRDNLALTPEEVVLRPLRYAVVDEVDFLLLDEARTPLIISGEAGHDPTHCLRAREIVAPLKKGRHFEVDQRTRQASVLEAGWSAMERALGIRNLADAAHQEWQHALHNALLAHAVYERDVDYIVRDDKAFIVDEFTGRVSEDKRFADGLHQALEAKEGLPVRPEDRTLAKTSYQTFFQLYPKLCGMTGTAASAKEELAATYGLRVVVVPTHRPLIRQDYADVVYTSGDEKFSAVVQEIRELRAAGRPVLVGTTSIRESERLSGLLGHDIPHEVLNAKNHAREAVVIAQAGRTGAVTISTNMAGRGVDILLGGNPDPLVAGGDPDPGALEARRVACAEDRERVVAAGGLAVLGTGLHEAARIDDQLSGRAGRQGDPGSSQYFLSLDDPVYRKFGHSLRFPEVLEALHERLADHPDNEPITDRSVLGALKELRKKVEVENEAIRKEVLKYDQVVEAQRRTIFGWRNRLLGTDGEEALALLTELTDEVGEDLVYRHFAGRNPILAEHYEELSAEVEARFGFVPDLDTLGPQQDWTPEAAGSLVVATLRAVEQTVIGLLGRELYAEAGRQLLLSTIDELWTDHLTTLERVDEGIGLRSYAELDPLVEYRREAGLLFQDLLREIRTETAARTCAFAAAEEAQEGRDEPLLPSQRREQRRTLKR